MGNIISDEILENYIEYNININNNNKKIFKRY